MANNLPNTNQPSSGSTNAPALILSPGQATLSGKKSRRFLKTRKAGFLLVGLAALALMGLGFHFFVHLGPHRQWSYALRSEGIVNFAPIVTNSTVYMFSDNPSVSTTLYALDRQSGSKKWSHQFSGSLDYAPRLSNGLMYAVSREVGEASSTLHVEQRGG